MSQRALCIMAAGLGSRFGSLKQLHAIVDDFAIIDFSIYDAIQAGFNEIILIIRKETQQLFEQHFSGFDTSHATITYVHQDNKTKSNSEIIEKRQKPWGTGHALLTLKSVISNNFALINADDYYGSDAFKLMFNNLYANSPENGYLIGYKLNNTLSPNGSVSRGECILNENDILKEVIERLNIRTINNQIYYDNHSEISRNTTVSMNFWGFTPSIFEIGERAFKKFLNQSDNLQTDEFFITTIVDEGIKASNFVFKVLKSTDQWYGITYPQDDLEIKQHLKSLINTKHYPKHLCNKTS